MIGVAYDLFWTLNPRSLQPFIKAFELKRINDDFNSWRSGYYIKLAIASSLSKECKYPDKPFSDKSISKPNEMSAEEIKEKMLRNMGIINSKFRKEE